MIRIKDNDYKMGFLENLGHNLGKEITERMETYDKTAKRCENISDDRLIKDYKKEYNRTKKLAMGRELQKHRDER